VECSIKIFSFAALKLHQQLIDITGQKGQVFAPKIPELGDTDEEADPDTFHLDKAAAAELFDRLCETNYKPFEALLKCGAYFKLESPINIWPPPTAHTTKDVFGVETLRFISRKIEICGYLALSEIGSPVFLSRHLILPKLETEKGPKSREFERLEADIKNFYAKTDNPAESTDENLASSSNNVSVCVLLHGALKIESMAALVLLGENWFGFVYSYADSKKKSNLMLTILPPGHDIIPWLGDLRYLGTNDDAPGENSSFPVKSEKRSYSQNIVVWIRQSSLQSDIQKVLRHAKKLPEKTQHFYKELNRIRRAALAFGFVELLDGLASIFERELAALPANANPEIQLQLKNVALELKKNNRDFKYAITALPTHSGQF
jgi:Integrator complex subunit 14